jgi:hypothetical protein
VAQNIERFIRIQNPDAFNGAASSSWRTIPNCEKLRVLEYLTLLVPNEETAVDERRLIFHINFVDGIRKGSRVIYLGNAFSVLTVSDSKRLVGLEICCVPEAPPSPLQPVEVREQTLRR